MDAQRTERIHDRIRDGRGRSGCPTFADSLDAHRIVRGRGLGAVGFEGGQVGGGGEEVGRQVAGQQLAVLVVDDAFIERLGKPLGDGAVELTVHNHRVDHRPAVVDGNVTEDLHRAGFRVHLDVGEVSAERKDGIRWIEARLHTELIRSARATGPFADVLDRHESAWNASYVYPPA